MKIFITGLTGSLGTALAKYHHDRGDTVYGCARDEYRAHRWLLKYQHLATLSICNCSSLLNSAFPPSQLLDNMHRLYHCAAMKHVGLCEANPQEAYNQNVVNTADISQLCKLKNIEFILTSSDKACMPCGVYGATKLLAEKIATHNQGAVVRLGNLIGSSGSVLETWLKSPKTIKLTNPSASRFFITIADAAAFMATQSIPKKVVVPKMKAASMGLIADALAENQRVDIQSITPRIGETDHQWLVFPGQKVQEGNTKLVLDQGGVSVSGICSATAERWSMPELLGEARQVEWL